MGKARIWTLWAACILIPPLLSLAYNYFNPNIGHSGKHSVHSPDTTWEFGVLNSGPTYKHSFNVVNHTSVPLRLLKASSSCGCTLPELPQAAIEPGEIGDIVVRLDSEGRSGTYSGSIVVETDSLEFPHIQFTILGEFHYTDADISIAPSEVFVETVLGAGGALERVILQREGTDPLGFESAVCDLDGVKVEKASDVDFTQRDQLRYAELNVIISDAFPVGRHKGNILIETNHARNRTKSIPITIDVFPNIETYPTEMIVHGGKKDDISGTVRLSSKLGTEIVIHESHVVGGVSGVLIEERVSDSIVDLKFTPNFVPEMKDVERCAIVIELFSGGANQVTIPVLLFSR